MCENAYFLDIRLDAQVSLRDGWTTLTTIDGVAGQLYGITTAKGQRQEVGF